MARQQIIHSNQSEMNTEELKTEELKKIQEQRIKIQEELSKTLNDLDEKELEIRFKGVPNYVGKYFRIAYGDLCMTTYLYVEKQQLNSATDCVDLIGHGIDEVLTMRFSSLTIKNPRQVSIHIQKLDRLEEISKDVFAAKVNQLIKNFRLSFARATNIELYDPN